MKFSDLIISYDNALPKDVCERAIKLFENDDRKTPGRVGNRSEYVPTLKSSIDLRVTDGGGEWDEIDKYFYNSLQKYLKEYNQFILSSFFFNGNDVEGWGTDEDSGYQIQRTDPGGKYDWHMDFTVKLNKKNKTTNVRYVTFIWYLNDVNSDIQQGRTQFNVGNNEIVSIEPKQGKLVLFPAFPMYVHRGEKLLSGVKYICTGWLTCNNFYD